MTTPTPMTHEELLELAALDALGLLDEYESALFTRSYHHAAVAVGPEAAAALLERELNLGSSMPIDPIVRHDLSAVS